MKNEEKIKSRLEKYVEDGKISCTSARRLAEELEVPVKEVGKMCDELKIKIHSCELGCF